MHKSLSTFFQEQIQVAEQLHQTILAHGIIFQ